MNLQATRHIVPPQACGYSDRSNRERRVSRHLAIALPRLPPTRNQKRGVTGAAGTRSSCQPGVRAFVCSGGGVDRADQQSTPPEEMVVPLAVLDDDQADRALRVFELRDGAEEGAAAEGGLEDPGGDVVTDSADKVAPCSVSACSVARAAIWSCAPCR